MQDEHNLFGLVVPVQDFFVLVENFHVSMKLSRELPLFALLAISALDAVLFCHFLGDS